MAQITPEACRAARALLGWSMRDLATRAGVSLAAVTRLEAGAGTSQERTLDKISASFAANGVQLVLQKGKSGAVLGHARGSGGGDVG